MPDGHSPFGGDGSDIGIGGGVPAGVIFSFAASSTSVSSSGAGLTGATGSGRRQGIKPSTKVSTAKLTTKGLRVAR
jgi:hypothetical protein